MAADDRPQADRAALFRGITFFFSIGGIAATLIRLELITPGPTLGSPDFYNRLFTMHGIIMVWFFLIPSIPTTMGNFILPMMIGARDLAFPRLNLSAGICTWRAD